MTAFIARGPVRLLLGLLIGLVAGMTLDGPAQTTLLAIARPIGALWLDALTMTVVPLVFGLLVTGVADASRQAEAGGTTLRAFGWFGVMLLAACLTGAALTQALLHIWPVAEGALASGAPAPPGPAAPTEWFRQIIPANPLRAAVDMAMVPLVTFALFLGFAVARIAPASGEALLKPLRALVEAMLVIVGWVLLVGPLGIAALALGAGAGLGMSAVGALAQYVILISGACLAATVLAYGWVGLGSRMPVLRFARAAIPAQAVALGTQSSLATLPVMVERASHLGVPAPVSGIVLPLAVSLFRAASGAANVAVTVYLAYLHGIALRPDMLLLAALIAVPVSLAAVGLPAQVSFFATIAPICIAIGVPVTMLPLLLAIEALPDLFRTLGNVTSDLAATCNVAMPRRRSKDL